MRGEDGRGEDGRGVAAVEVGALDVGALADIGSWSIASGSVSSAESDQDMGNGEIGLVRSCFSLMEVKRFFRLTGVMCFSPNLLQSQPACGPSYET